MVSDIAAGVASGSLGEAADVGEEADQLVGFGRQGVGAGAQVGVIVERVRQVVLQHAAARAGGHDDVVVADGGLDDVAGQVARGGAVAAAVVGRLAAAGLRPGAFDLAAGFLKQADGEQRRRWGGRGPPGR